MMLFSLDLIQLWVIILLYCWSCFKNDF